MATTEKHGLSLLSGASWRQDGSDAARIDENTKLLDELLQTSGDILSLLFAQAFASNFNVKIQNLHSGDVLGYEESTGLWKNYPNGQAQLEYVDGGTF